MRIDLQGKLPYIKFVNFVQKKEDTKSIEMTTKDR